MINKEKAGPLVQEIAERVLELRALIRSGAEDTAEDQAFAGDVVMLGATTKRLADKCGIEI